MSLSLQINSLLLLGILHWEKVSIPALVDDNIIRPVSVQFGLVSASHLKVTLKYGSSTSTE